MPTLLHQHEQEAVHPVGRPGRSSPGAARAVSANPATGPIPRSSRNARAAPRQAARRQQPDGTALCESSRGSPVRTCSSCGTERPASLGADGATATPATGGFASPAGPAAGAGWYGPSRPGPPRQARALLQLQRPAPARPLRHLRKDKARLPARRSRLRLPVLPTAPPGTLLRLRPARRVHARWPRGPDCPACYVQILDHPGRCPRCGTARPLIAPAARPCAGAARHAGRLLGQGCGTSGRLYADGLCPRAAASAAPPPPGRPRRRGPRAVRARRPGSRRGQEPARGAAVAEAEPERAPARRPRGQR